MFTMMTSTRVQNQRDYTLGLFEWVEEGFRVRTCEWRKVKETIWLSCICGSYVPVIQTEHFRAIMQAYEIVGWSELNIRHSDTEGEGLSFKELIGNARVSPLKPCIYALLMKCDGGWAGCVCMRERMYLFIVCIVFIYRCWHLSNILAHSVCR